MGSKALRTIAAAVSIAACPGAWAQPSQAREALDGVDTVVLLTQGKEVFGRSELRVERGRFVYLFSSAETRAAFERAPEKYEIQMGGLCATMGRGASGNPSDYAVVDGRIYIFGSDDCHKRFVAAPAKFMAPEAAPMPDGAGAKTRGRELVERAVEAAGGAERIDAIATYVESSTRVQTTPRGSQTAVSKVMWRLPGSVRFERTIRNQDRTMTFGTVLTPAGAWSVGPDGSFMPLVEQARSSFEQEYGRALVPLLRGRGGPAFKAAALEPAAMDGVEVDRVRIQSGAVDVTLGIDRATGAVRGMTFVDRGPTGEFGEYTLLFSDVRDVDGLAIPFAVRALFNGSPDQALTRTLESVAVNLPLDAALFAPPAAAAR